jgi:cation diffusion facilitator family transporter
MRHLQPTGRTKHDPLMTTSPEDAAHSLARYAWLSIATAVFTMVLKAAAYFATGSVGLLSDAMESFVNLLGGIMALAMLRIAAQPADEHHAYGHGKAEYFSSLLEGTLILFAAASIGWAAVGRLLAPVGLEQIGLGFILSTGASLANLATALVLLRAARRYHSVTLEANGHHLMTDVWTSVGVLGGVAGVALTGWQWIDPVLALAVAANIVWTGFRIIQKSVLGFMDTALPARELSTVRAVLDGFTTEDLQYHALRTRRAGSRRFVSLHVLVPGQWTVQTGHDLCEQIEAAIRASLPNVTVFTHLESLNDPASWDDIKLDRPKQ